ncbi:MAG: hypothetical protein QNK04_13175 [Myxococcota bacterium]|nr:hypothetical protein [Myxococcota bacterium]
MAPLRVYFLGRRQGFLANAKGPFRRTRIENSRRGEAEAFHESPDLVRTWSIQDADIVYVRNKPQHTTRFMARQIRRRLRRAPGTYVVNPIEAFETIQAKDATFEAWRRMGIACPEHAVWEPELAIDELVERARSFLDRHGEAYLRTNNEEGGKGLCWVAAGTTEAELRGTIEAVRGRALARRASSAKLLAVERIRPAPGHVNRIHRAHVYEDEILSGYALASPRPIVHARDLRVEDTGAFVAANREFAGVVARQELRREILRAARALGCNIGAVEFFVRDGSLVFLELNPMWGGRHCFGDDAFMRHLAEHQTQLSPEIPNVYQWLDFESYYRKLFADIHRHARARLGRESAAA